MDVPLARFLTRFSSDEDVVEEPVLVEAPAPLDVDMMIDTDVALEMNDEPAVDEFELKLEAMRQELEAKHLSEIESLKSDHEVLLSESLDTARAHWCEAEGKALSTRLDEVVTELRSYFSEKIADVLMPTVAEALISRTRDALLESLDLVLADRDRPILTIRGPGDLLDTIRAAHPDTIGVEYVAHSDLDVIVTGDGLRIETRLEQALTVLTQQEI